MVPLLDIDMSIAKDHGLLGHRQQNKVLFVHLSQYFQLVNLFLNEYDHWSYFPCKRLLANWVIRCQVQYTITYDNAITERIKKCSTTENFKLTDHLNPECSWEIWVGSFVVLLVLPSILVLWAYPQNEGSWIGSIWFMSQCYLPK